MTVEYHPAVEKELQSIRDWYNSKALGLGTEFVDEFERQVLRIAASPARWMVITKDIRRVMMRRFPYVIYYRVVRTDLVRITIVKHQRRHPEYGRNRF